MASYKTHQKDMLLGYLAELKEPCTIDEICDGLSSSAEAPGKSTVYRLINRLVEEGSVKRFVKSGSKQFVYQLVADEECHHHLHMKCVNCGKLLHMEHKMSEELIGLIAAGNEFAVDSEETTLFGKCKECKECRN